MKVLLTQTDLFKEIGGGQTVYRKLIEISPTIDFYYFRVTEPHDAPKPNNAHSIPLSYRRALRLNVPPPFPAYKKNALEEADAIARSVAGQRFDIIESADYFTFGSALRDACDHHGVTVGRFILSMHGNISKSIDLNWGSTGDKVLEIEILEKRQFAEADSVYGISRRYIKEWQQKIDRNVYFIDPLHFVNCDVPSGAWECDEKPSLYCIGRSERRKGNDLFIELTRWLNPTTIGSAEHIGDSDFSNGVSSAYHLSQIAKLRGIDVTHQPSQSQSQLLALYKKPSIIVIPTRYDTLNLVALEALFSGCPVAISSKAGVCDYLDEHHPNIPYTKLDLGNLYGNITALGDIIENYNERRSELHEALIRYPPVASPILDIQSIYVEVLEAPARTQSTFDRRNTSLLDAPSATVSHPPGKLARNTSAKLAYREDKLSLQRQILDIARRFTPGAVKNHIRPYFDAPRSVFIDWLRQSGYFGDAHYFAITLDSWGLPSRLRDVERKSERNKDAVKEKLGTNYFYASLSTVFRCNFWNDIARLERLRKNELMAATYELRLLRLLGHDKLGMLPDLTETLEKNGFDLVAETTGMLYSSPTEAEEMVYDYLKDRFEQLKVNNEKLWEFLDDRRVGEPKVSVIVSLYNAADKLRFFLTALAQQTLVRKGLVEIILVDSGSPTNERGVFDAFHLEQPLSVVYGRSPQRETIQAAWNRGIKLARAPYLVFLGADEGLYPEALEVLANELDDHPESDWVMANSLVTEVEESGLYKNDVMPYDRSGATKDHVYLETCYLSWVGGMYRRDIHEHFGYYDEIFRGAGDTEFKNRILPHINVRFIDQMLGIFFNYPDGQTTASPMAEIEDSRAWYLFRTAGGVRYAFENRPIEDAENLLKLCLGYRKSYCRHYSTDVEYGVLLADYILKRDPKSKLANLLAPALRNLLEGMRQLEFAWAPKGRIDVLRLLVSTWRSAEKSLRSDEVNLKTLGINNSEIRILNDNRYEQHSWLWKSI